MYMPAPAPRTFGPQQPVIVFGPQFALSYETELVIKEKFSWSGDDASIKDTAGRKFFKVKSKTFSLHNKRVILDMNGVPLFNIKEKAFSLHTATTIYMGEDQNDANIVCTIREVLLSFKPQAHVFFKGNQTKEPDLIISGDFFARRFYINDKHGATLAEASRDVHTLGGFVAGNDTYYVLIPPQVDIALIVGLINVVEEMFVDPYQNAQSD